MDAISGLAKQPQLIIISPHRSPRPAPCSSPNWEEAENLSHLSPHQGHECQLLCLMTGMLIMHLSRHMETPQGKAPQYTHICNLLWIEP